jgi:hypothetical protein
MSGVELPEKDVPNNVKSPDKKVRSQVKPLWKQHVEEGSGDRSRTALLMVVTMIVIIIVLAGVLLMYALRPGPKTVYSELSVKPEDVSILASTPSGDNKTAIVPVEVELRNIGEGKSGVINVWCGAYNRSNENQRFDDFNTTDLWRVDSGQTVSAIEPAGKPGSIVRARGNLSLPPGDYQVRLRIYEDGGKRTLVYGYIFVSVDQSMVATPQPYVPEGGGRGRSTTESAGAGSLPGFELPVALAAAAAVIVLTGMRRKSERSAESEVSRKRARKESR